MYFFGICLFCIFINLSSDQGARGYFLYDNSFLVHSLEELNLLAQLERSIFVVLHGYHFCFKFSFQWELSFR